MATQTRLTQVLPAAVALALVALAVPLGARQNVRERFTGFAINLNAGPKTAMVDLAIDRWSTDGEREQLIGIIRREKDPTSTLLRALQKMPKVGFIRTATSLAWDLRYSRQAPLPEGGRQIVLATDRPIAFGEVWRSTRSMDYPFTIIEIRLDKNDRGEGKILAGTKIYIDKRGNIALEHYGQQPVRFNEIRKAD